MASDRTIDSRLLGVWRSDKEQTLREWAFSPTTSSADKSKIEALFGKFIVRYTPARVFTEFEGSKTVCSYRVVAVDDESVAIVCRTEDRNEIRHIHFSDNNTYWVSCGRNREFFNRVA